MNRVEELTLKLADGDLAEAEAVELAELVADDTAARLTHLRLLEIEGGLRSRHAPADLAPAIIARIKADGVAKLSERVLDRIKADAASRVLPFPSPGAVRSEEGVEVMPCRWRKGRVTRTLALAASVALLLGLGVWFFGPTMGAPVLAELNGAEVTVERGTEFIPAAKGTRLLPGDVVRTGTKASVTVGFGAERTRFVLAVESELKVASFITGKRFDLRVGTLNAEVARQRPFQPMIITTPNAEARVLGTRFTLTAATNTTRLDVAEGKVRLTRASDRAQVGVPAEHYAIATADSVIAALPQTGWIYREYWTNLSGKLVQTLDFSKLPAPATEEWLTRLETTNGWGENYAARWRGYLHPPITGRYDIGLSASDEAFLFLSRDDQPEHKANSMIIQQHQNTQLQRPQNRKTFELTDGRRYYIEVLHKAGRGLNHLSMTWKRPDGKVEIIGGESLSPFKPKPKVAK